MLITVTTAAMTMTTPSSRSQAMTFIGWFRGLEPWANVGIPFFPMHGIYGIKMDKASINLNKYGRESGECMYIYIYVHIVDIVKIHSESLTRIWIINFNQIKKQVTPDQLNPFLLCQPPLAQTAVWDYKHLYINIYEESINIIKHRHRHDITET